MSKVFRRLLGGALAATVPLLCVTLAGCEEDDEYSVTREVQAYVAGVYRNNDTNFNRGFLVAHNTGSPVEQLDLRQYGDRLQGIDNHGIYFEGHLGRFVSDNTIEFELKGKTSAGNEAIMSGTIEIDGGKGKMRGTWIEPTLTSTIYGEATGPTIKTNVAQKVATPVFSPGSTTFATSITVTVSTPTSGATIRYTTNNTEPTESSTTYTTPLTFTTTTTLKAKAYLQGWEPSDTATATYTKRP